MRIFLFGICLAFGSIGAAGACSSADFEVKDFKIDVKRCSGARCPRLRLEGILVNKCSSAAAARIEIQGKDENGAVLGSAEGWPASTRNLAPGEEVEFDFGPLIKFDQRLVNFDVLVIEVKSW